MTMNIEEEIETRLREAVEQKDVLQAGDYLAMAELLGMQSKPCMAELMGKARVLTKRGSLDLWMENWTAYSECFHEVDTNKETKP